MPKTVTAFGTFSTELMRDDTGCVIDYWEQPVPEQLASLAGDDTELVIEFAARIYHLPMSMYGGADRMGWPEEYSDERELRRAYLIDNKTKMFLDSDLASLAFAHYLERIEQADVEFPEDNRY